MRCPCGSGGRPTCTTSTTLSSFIVLFFLVRALAAAAADDPDYLPGTHRIPRESGLSLRDFWERYADQQQPVIITDHLDCFVGMSVANIQRLCGDKEVTLSKRANASGAWASLANLDAEYSLGDILQDGIRRVLQVSEDDIVGLFDRPLHGWCDALLDEHFIVPKYVAQDFLQRVPRTEELLYRNSWPSLFVGLDGSFGGLHVDTFGSSFSQYVIQGEKEWHSVDASIGLDFFAQPRTHAVRHYHDVVRPGELLILPGNSQHQVRNRGSTVALAGNFVSRGSMGTLAAELKASGTSGKYYKQLTRTLMLPEFNTTVDGACDGSAKANAMPPLLAALSCSPSLPRSLTVPAAVVSGCEWLSRAETLGDLPWKEFKGQSDIFPSPGISWGVDVGGEKPKPEWGTAFVVSGAGSTELNGRYTYSGFDTGHEYAMRLELPGSTTTSTTRFLLFRVEVSEWWNLAKHVSTVDGDAYTTYYAATKPREDLDGPEYPLGPTAVWRNSKPSRWHGVLPPPTVLRATGVKGTVNEKVEL